MIQNDELRGFAVQINVHIRPMKREDLPLIEWYGQFSHLRYLFQRAYQGQIEGSRQLLVAESRNFPIGRLFLSYTGKNPTLADGATRGYLYSFQVMEAFQGLGIGTQLIQSAEQLLAQQQYRWATLAVAKTNLRAMRLYRRLGFRMFGEDLGAYTYRDHQGMLREVNEPSYLLEKKLTIR